MPEETIRQAVGEQGGSVLPTCGVFCCVDGQRVTRLWFQRPADPATGHVFVRYDGWRPEHRDMRDDLIRPEYPAAAKALRRRPPGTFRRSCGDGPGTGRAAFVMGHVVRMLNTENFREQIVRIFGLQGQAVRCCPDTMNYSCRACRKREKACSPGRSLQGARTGTEHTSRP